MERFPLLTSVAVYTSYEGVSKLLLHHTGLYWAMSDGPEEAKIDRDGIRNFVSMNWLAKLTKEKRPNKKFTAWWSTNKDTNLVWRLSI